MGNEKSLAEIDIKLKKVNIEVDEREKTDPNNGWDVYCEHMQSVWDKRDKLNRERRMLMTPEFRDLSDIGDVMSLEDFVMNVKDGGFIDYDGSGNYVRDGKESNISIYPSDIRYDSVRDDFDSVAWYNR